MPSPAALARALACAFALTALALPASAGAVPVTVQPPVGGETLAPRVAAAVAVGERRFGPACPGGVLATWTDFEVAYPGKPGARAWGRSFAAECRIEFNLSVWLDPDWRAGVYDWPWLCTLVVHEYGHLAGHGHSDDAGDVMHATIERITPECRSRPPAAAAGGRKAKRRVTETLRRRDAVRRARR